MDTSTRPSWVKNCYDTAELLAFGQGEIEGAPELPLPPMLMLDRIVEITDDGGADGMGFIRAQYDIYPSRWFFPCHFKSNPIMPGCLGIDGVWQSLGFFIGWCGATGQGAATGIGNVMFRKMITPKTRVIEYRLDITRKSIHPGKKSYGVADATVYCDGEPNYEMQGATVFFTPKKAGA